MPPATRSAIRNRLLWLALALTFLSIHALGFFAQDRTPPAQSRNVLIFVFDGLRGGSVNTDDAPTMFWIAQHGVRFANSHSLFPTFTTANASAIATGHYLGRYGRLQQPDFTSDTPYFSMAISAVLRGVMRRTSRTTACWAIWTRNSAEII